MIWGNALPGRQILVLIAALALCVGCGSQTPPPDRVAELDGRAISHQAFERFLRQNSVDGAGVLGSDVLSSLLDQFLDEQLLARLAADRLSGARDLDARAAIQLLIEDSGVAIDDAAVALFYRRNLSRFELPDRVVLRQLLFTDQRSAERIRDLWSQGAPYKSVMEALSSAPGAHVGEEGEFTRSGLPPGFAEVLFSLPAGEVSEVLIVEYGFHVFQVVQHLPAGLIPWRVAEPEIRAELENRQDQETVSRLVAEARGRYNVLVFERNLPFNYVGRYGTNNGDESS